MDLFEMSEPGKFCSNCYVLKDKKILHREWFG